MANQAMTLMTLVIVLSAASSYPASAACSIDDATFTTTSAGGCEDIATGLVWSSDVLAPLGVRRIFYTNADYYCSQVFSGLVDKDGDGQPEIYPEAGGQTDWRAPTVREVLTALDNGLATHLDYSYDAGIQPVDSRPRWTQCTALFMKGLDGGFAVDHTNGTYTLQQEFYPGEYNQELVCVRGAPANLDQDCPNKKGNLPSEDGGSGGGKGNGNGKGKNTMHLPRSVMGTLLVLPALVIGGCGYLRRRR